MRATDFCRPLRLAILAAALPSDAFAQSPSTVYNARAGQTAVKIPRLEGTGVETDGRLTEPEWTRAAVLTGFSQFSPADGIAADDSTDVLVWYSPTAIHFGIRAYEKHGAVNATLADRDRIFGDDHVQIYLGTFNDGRQATVIAVNPLGVQADGALVETGRTSGGFTGGLQTREPTDLSQDFTFASKGHVTEYGYEVEIRVPFKSLRYPATAVQNWAINIARTVQHSGFENTWTPARRAGTSFLAQSGTLQGLTELRRGLVLDLNPVVTERVTGSRVFGTDDFDYRDGRPEFGGNVRWGITTNLTLNGTVNPDFSQVESDAGQVVFDPRNALFFPERRPFFLDGIEQFQTPSNLIYTRRIVQPVGAVKLTGKVGGTSIAYLSALDDRPYSRTGEETPVYNILRLQRDVAAQSRIGLAYTDRMDGEDYNRVAAIDSRIVFRKLYSSQFQLAGSRTERAGLVTDGPLWVTNLVRNGRRFGFRYTFSGVDPDFRAGSGFIGRAGVVRANASHRLTTFGKRDAFLQTLTSEIVLDGNWRYRSFTRRQDIQDKKLHFNFNGTVKGGWDAGASVLVETFGYDDALYSNYFVERRATDGTVRDTVPFTGVDRIFNLDYLLRFSTPRWQKFNGNAFIVWGRDENFLEWASADIVFLTMNADWRPTGQLRINPQYQLQSFSRRTDGSTVQARRIPRLKVEYQLNRAIFVRLVGQYDALEQDSLRDDSRTNDAILFRGSSGFFRTNAFRARGLRADWLFSYQPTPGTVFFAGYGSSLAVDPESEFGLGRLPRMRDIERINDGFFVKLSYLYRL